MKTDLEKYKLALHLHNTGKYKEAIGIAYQISRASLRAGILIDSGTGANSPKIIREGVELYEALLKSGQHKISRASLLYNIGNGYSSIYKLRLLKRARVTAPNDDDLRMAKKEYRNALAETKDNPPSLRSRTLVNFGNCLSMLGRCFEAIQAYSASLELEPQNGMAAGNLGIELERVARITGRYAHHYILVAHQFLTQACSPEMHLSYGDAEAARKFRDTLERLQDIIDAHKGGFAPLTEISFSEKRTSKSRYMQFCLKHQLFLNAWVGISNVMPAISDEIAFGPITTAHNDNKTVPELLRVLNEIKEAFTTARYLFYHAQSKSNVLDGISSITSYFDYESKDLHGLCIGLCKSAYMRSFDVLDKVARIVNVYFGIGNRNDYFWYVFAEKQSRGESHEIRFGTRPAILATQNYSLFALSDLCIDYFESEQVDFKTIDVRRNRMTHDYLAVVDRVAQTPNENEIAIDELYRQTLAVIRLAKYAILYVVSAVHIAERQKEKSKEHVVKYKQSPGHTAKIFSGFWGQTAKKKKFFD